MGASIARGLSAAWLGAGASACSRCPWLYPPSSPAPRCTHSLWLHPCALVDRMRPCPETWEQRGDIGRCEERSAPTSAALVKQRPHRSQAVVTARIAAPACLHTNRGPGIFRRPHRACVYASTEGRSTPPLIINQAHDATSAKCPGCVAFTPRTQGRRVHNSHAGLGAVDHAEPYTACQSLRIEGCSCAHSHRRKSQS